MAQTKIRIVSADQMRTEIIKTIGEHFAQKLNLTDYSVQEEIDENLVAGFIVYVAGYRYDYSAQGHLDDLGEKLLAKSSFQHELKAMLEESIDFLNEAETLSFDYLSQVEVPSSVEEKTTTVSKAPLVHFLKEENHLQVEQFGEVQSVADGIAYVSGLQHCQYNELLSFPNHIYGIAMNLEKDRVGVIVLGDSSQISRGTYCKRTGSTVSVPTGLNLLGRVVDAMGTPIDGKGVFESYTLRPIEFEAASVMDRQTINQPLYTGITAIDAMTPIGRGQRELIIGDRQTGKTSIAIDSILNQKGKDVLCIYVAIGQKMSNVAQVVRTLEKRGAMEYTTVVVASASDSAALQYIAPYSGCTIAEQWMYEENRDVLIVYDDLSKHAVAYRTLSLLLKRPPGREAFPGDVFYLHSRLLERALRLSAEKGGHSITALPIVETQAGDISAYIPTNVISITDGQIYLETELFFSGQRPAINVGLSVSRVGGAAQTKVMKSVAGPLRMQLAQYRELKAFAQFGSELDAATQAVLNKGARISEILKQSQHASRRLAIHVILLSLATRGKLDALELMSVRSFCEHFEHYLSQFHLRLLDKIEQVSRLTEDTLTLMDEVFQAYLKQWQEDKANGTIV